MRKILLILTICFAIVFLFASCGEKDTFNINFIVDGADYSSVSTMGDEAIKMPEDPAKEGYTFDGWYFDEDSFEQPFSSDYFLDAEIASDVTVYAKWNHTHVSSEPVTATSDEVCKYCGAVIKEAYGIYFKTIDIDDSKAYIKLSSATESFSFKNEIGVNGGAKYIVSCDEYGLQSVPTKIVPLNYGDNTFYIMEMVGDEAQRIYTIVIRRRPVYEVSFATGGGTAVESQMVEEDGFATEPTTSREGYTFAGWEYDFSLPVTSDAVITAKWTPNTDTLYTVEYYLQNLEDDGYSKKDELTEKKYGITDATATAEKKTVEHFTFNAEHSKTSGVVSADGSLVIKLYYDRNTYNLSSATESYGGVMSAGDYKYGSRVTATAVENLGCELLGWYSGEELLSSELKYTYDAVRDVTARFAPKAEMANYDFISTPYMCEILRIKDRVDPQLVIPEYVTHIGEDAFLNAIDLISITLPNSLVEIGDNAFKNCYKLVEVINNSNLRIYAGRSGIGYVGYYAKIVHSNESRIAKVGDYLFYSDASGDYLLSYVGSNSTLTLPASYNEKSYKIYDYAFYGVESVETVNVSGGVTAIGSYAFSACRGLVKLTLQRGVNNIGDFAFYRCYKLIEIANGSALNITPGSEENGYVAYYAKSVCTDDGKMVKLDDFLFYINGDVNYLIGYMGTSTDVTLPESYNGAIYQIYDSAFYNCDAMIRVSIPDGITEIPASAFRACKNLVSISIPDSVNKIGDYAFYGCESLEQISLPIGVTNIANYIFYGCKSLESVSFGGDVTYIRSHAFEECSSLESITIPDKVTVIGWAAFKNCTSLSDVVIGKGVERIANLAFSGCASLESIVIPASVNNISDFAFYGCEKLTSAKFENTAGWKARGDKVSETELKDTAKAAAYLSDEEGLVYYDWVRG